MNRRSFLTFLGMAPLAAPAIAAAQSSPLSSVSRITLLQSSAVGKSTLPVFLDEVDRYPALGDGKSIRVRGSTPVTGLVDAGRDVERPSLSDPVDTPTGAGAFSMFFIEDAGGGP